MASKARQNNLSPGVDKAKKYLSRIVKPIEKSHRPRINGDRGLVRRCTPAMGLSVGGALPEVRTHSTVLPLQVRVVSRSLQRSISSPFVAVARSWMEHTSTREQKRSRPRTQVGICLRRQRPNRSSRATGLINIGMRKIDGFCRLLPGEGGVREARAQAQRPDKVLRSNAKVSCKEILLNWSERSEKAIQLMFSGTGVQAASRAVGFYY